MIRFRKFKKCVDKDEKYNYYLKYKLQNMEKLKR